MSCAVGDMGAGVVQERLMGARPAPAPHAARRHAHAQHLVVRVLVALARHEHAVVDAPARGENNLQQGQHRGDERASDAVTHGLLHGYLPERLRALWGLEDQSSPPSANNMCRYSRPPAAPATPAPATPDSARPDQPASPTHPQRPARVEVVEEPTLADRLRHGALEGLVQALQHVHGAQQRPAAAVAQLVLHESELL